MEIYVVTQGSYSDYHIVGVFTDELKAQELCDWIRERGTYDGPQIETYQSDIINIKGRELFFVRMQPDGKVLEVEEEDYFYDINSNDTGRDINGNFYTTCLAKDKQHAIKIMSERKLRYKVENNI